MLLVVFLPATQNLQMTRFARERFLRQSGETGGMFLWSGVSIRVHSLGSNELEHTFLDLFCLIKDAFLGLITREPVCLRCVLWLGISKLCMNIRN